MIKEGMFVRCPIDIEYPNDPRVFATGKVKSTNSFNETAHILFLDPFHYKEFFEGIPKEVNEVPLRFLEPCHLCKGARVKVGRKEAEIVEYIHREDGGYDYYIQDCLSKEYYCVGEEKIEGSFFSGSVKPSIQLMNYEFHNPCWYLGRQTVKNTMNVLDNSIFGFKELAGCKIYLKAFQINTIVRCLQDDSCRYMIADEVGLGKTIEACSVLKIYLKNKSNKNILISTPSSLIGQWRTELLFKFGITETKNENDNNIILKPVEELTSKETDFAWDFVIIDEVHNYIKDLNTYEKIHSISENSKNIILLSATPIQQRKNEYYNLLRLIMPQKYDSIKYDDFSSIVEKQNKITRIVHELLDEINSFKNELLPDIDEDSYFENEDVLDELEEIKNKLQSLSQIIEDLNLKKMVDTVDMHKEDFGFYDIKVIVSYVCDNYQFERNIIRGRRAVLGVYPNDEKGEFSSRGLVEIQYSLSDDSNFYENEAYRNLKNWIVSCQNELDDNTVELIIKPILESFFSSSFSYNARLKEISQTINDIPDEVFKSAKRWEIEEENNIENMADYLDDINIHSSRLLLLINYIETELYGKKVVLFTNQPETFEVYYRALVQAFGNDEVAGFSITMGIDKSEIDIYRFQSDSRCNILICDKTGGEGRNLQMADFLVHIDLPWDINSIEQRIGRLDRMGRDVKIPVTSIVIHTNESYEDQLFKFWNEGLNVFHQSLSGLEIIMNEINNKIIKSIENDFEYGLYNLVPDLVDEAKKMREIVQREQIFDTAALRYKPLYNQLERLLSNYHFNENSLFGQTMMSWASLVGFGKSETKNKEGYVCFEESGFSIKSAQNSFLIPPNWEIYLNKKQNEVAIRVQRGLEEIKEKNVNHNNRKIIGTFDRDIAIKNDYIHFYAPGDEIFDCVTNNALCSYRGMSTAMAAKSMFEWKGFIYTFSIEPNARLLLDNGISPLSLGLFRQYLSTSIQIIPTAFAAYQDVPEKDVLLEHKRLIQTGYFKGSDEIEHLGRRGKGSAFLNIPSKYGVSNSEWFKSKFPEENWVKFVNNSSKNARSKAKERFYKESDLAGAKEMIEQIISTNQSRALYYETLEEMKIDQIKKKYEIIYESLSNPIVRMESACFLWLRKENG